MTAQEFYDQLLAEIDSLATQIEVAQATIVTLSAQKAHDIFVRDNFGQIVNLANANQLTFDNPKLFICYDLATELAALYPNPEQDLSETVAFFFNKIVKLIK